MCACMHACMRACVRACVRVRVCVCRGEVIILRKYGSQCGLLRRLRIWWGE